jgi:hypothetical protein
MIDDGRPWGWMDEGVFRLLPKAPMLAGGYGPPPFTLEVWSGPREIVSGPAPDGTNGGEQP